VKENEFLSPLTTSTRRPNTALQTDERRVSIAACRWQTLAPLGAERQIR
jgi:hypothetical protein